MTIRSLDQDQKSERSLIREDDIMTKRAWDLFEEVIISISREHEIYMGEHEIYMTI